MSCDAPARAIGREGFRAPFGAGAEISERSGSGAPKAREFAAEACEALGGPAGERVRALVREAGPEVPGSVAAELRPWLTDRLLLPVASVLDDGASAGGLDGGVEAAFEQHPGLRRLVEVICEQWVGACGDFVSRLAGDLDLIGSTLGAAADRVVAVRSPLSDPHRDGRAVIRVELASGASVAYKPRGLADEVAYNEFLRYLAARLPDLVPRPLAVLDRGSYGWVEWVADAPCADRAGIERFYRRAGALLAILYFLGGSDVHWENLVAAGEHPVLVDAETLCPPGRPGGPWSVLGIGLLPELRLAPDGTAVYDASGLGGRGGQVLVPGPGNPGAGPGATVGEMVTRRRRNLPLLEGEQVDVLGHAAPLAEGFAQAHRQILRSAAEICAEDGPLAGFRQVHPRLVLRNTRLYDEVLRRALRPEALRTPQGLEGALAELLADSPRAWGDLEASRQAEVDALARCDIPIFHLDPRTLEVRAGGSRIGCLAGFEPGPAAQVKRLRGGSRRECELQICRARAAIAAAEMSVAELGEAPAEPPGGGRLLEIAMEVAEALRRGAARDADGSPAWVTAWPTDGGLNYRIGDAGGSLYHGRAGIALYLAAVHRVTGCAASAKLAAEALDATERRLSDAARRPEIMRRAELGFSGLGGLAYASAVGRALLGGHGGAAAELAAAIATDSELQPEWDLIGGSAGCALAMLACHRTDGGEVFVAAAERCGRDLVAAGPFVPPRLCGLAHGSAGRALALAELSRLRADDACLAAVDEEVANLGESYSSRHRSWPDRRNDPVTFGLASWCHGTAGIGTALLRLQRRPRWSSGALTRMLDGALATTAEAETRRLALCCGLAGGVSLLLDAGEERRDPDLSARGAELAAALAARYGERVRRASDRTAAAALPAGLMQGASGIGFTLLRAGVPSAALPQVTSLTADLE